MDPKHFDWLNPLEPGHGAEERFLDRIARKITIPKPDPKVQRMLEEQDVD